MTKIRCCGTCKWGIEGDTWCSDICDKTAECMVGDIQSLNFSYRLWEERDPKDVIVRISRADLDSQIDDMDWLLDEMYSRYFNNERYNQILKRFLKLKKELRPE